MTLKVLNSAYEKMQIRKYVTRSIQGNLCLLESAASPSLQGKTCYNCCVWWLYVHVYSPRECSLTSTPRKYVLQLTCA